MKPIIGLIIIFLLIYYVFLHNKNKIKKKSKNVEPSFKFNLWKIIKYLPLILSYVMIPGW